MKKTLHVLYTGLTSDTILTGGDQLFLDIAPRLPNDLKIIVVAPEFAKHHFEKLHLPNMEYRLLPPNRFDLKDNLILVFLSYVVRAWHVNRILRKEEVQTIYSSSDIAYADVWPAFLAVGRNPKIKWISRIYHILLPPKERQGNYLVNLVVFRLQRLSFWMMKRRSSKVLALNDKLYDVVLGLGFPKAKLDVLEAGIDFQSINRFKPSKTYPYDVAVLARVAPVKGIFDAVKAWKEVHEALPDLRLAWVGGGLGQYERQVGERIKENKIQDSFELLGFVENDQKYSVLKSAKIFLCADHENGWGLAVCEAMACGLPVVAYNLDIFGGVYKKGYVSVPLYDTHALAKAIIDLYGDENRRLKIAKDALAQAKEFDHDRVVSKLIGFIYEG